MGLLGKLFGNPTPRLESPDDDPEAKRLRNAQQKNDWKNVQGFFSKLTDPTEREFYVENLSDWKQRPTFFDAWVEGNPGCAEAWLLRGAHGTQWAWEARTGAQAEQVPQEAWAVFFERLKSAWEDLNRAIEINPADPTPFGFLIPCAMGLQMEKELVFRCLENTIARSVVSWKAHSATLFYLCKKWYGSHEEMFEFVRSVSASAPDGSGLHALIPIAHHERYLYAFAFDRDKEFAEAYYDQPEIRREIVDAYHRSLGSRAFKPDKMTYMQSGFFALALVQCQAYMQARTELERLNNIVPKFPWGHYGDPIDSFTQAKEIVKRKMG